MIFFTALKSQEKQGSHDASLVVFSQQPKIMEEIVLQCTGKNSGKHSPFLSGSIYLLWPKSQIGFQMGQRLILPAHCMSYVRYVIFCYHFICMESVKHLTFCCLQSLPDLVYTAKKSTNWLHRIRYPLLSTKTDVATQFRLSTGLTISQVYLPIP